MKSKSKLSTTWMDLIRRDIYNGISPEKTVEKLIQYGFFCEKEVNEGFGRTLTYEEYIQSFDGELEFYDSYFVGERK